MTKVSMRVFGRELVSKDGRKFYTYSYTKDGKKFYKVKFRRGCQNVPQGKGYFNLTVDKDTLSIQHYKDEPTWNSVIWVNECLSCATDDEANTAYQAKLNHEVEELF